MDSATPPSPSRPTCTYLRPRVPAHGTAVISLSSHQHHRRCVPAGCRSARQRQMPFAEGIWVSRSTPVLLQPGSRPVAQRFSRTARTADLTRSPGPGRSENERSGFICAVPAAKRLMGCWTSARLTVLGAAPWQRCVQTPRWRGRPFARAPPSGPARPRLRGHRTPRQLGCPARMPIVWS